MHIGLMLQRCASSLLWQRTHTHTSVVPFFVRLVVKLCTLLPSKKQELPIIQAERTRAAVGPPFASKAVRIMPPWIENSLWLRVQGCVCMCMCVCACVYAMYTTHVCACVFVCVCMWAWARGGHTHTHRFERLYTASWGRSGGCLVLCQDRPMLTSLCTSEILSLTCRHTT
jgi:hypothetical protein